MGGIVLQFITGKVPFCGDAGQGTMRLVNHITPLRWAEEKFKEELFGTKDGEDGDTLYAKCPEFQSFLDMCLTYDYKERPGADLLLGHPFMTLTDLEIKKLMRIGITP